MVDAEGTKRVFTEFYAKLTETLPIKDLVTELYANNLLTDNHKAEVQSLTTKKEKAQYFLDEVIKPGLNIGYTGQFNKMISVMESSDDPVVKFLAKQIQEFILDSLPSTSTSDDNSKNTYMLLLKGLVKIYMFCDNKYLRLVSL